MATGLARARSTAGRQVPIGRRASVRRLAAVTERLRDSERMKPFVTA
jgi:hypothetical protein